MLKGVKRNANTVNEKLTELTVLLLQNPYIINGKLRPPPTLLYTTPNVYKKILIALQIFQQFQPPIKSGGSLYDIISNSSSSILISVNKCWVTIIIMTMQYEHQQVLDEIYILCKLFPLFIWKSLILLSAVGTKLKDFTPRFKVLKWISYFKTMHLQNSWWLQVSTFCKISNHVLRETFIPVWQGKQFDIPQ